MTYSLGSKPLRYLQGGAYLVIILWGVTSTSQVLVPVLLALLLAYSFLPLPRWLMKRLNLGKKTAIALAGASTGGLILGLVLLICWRFTQIQDRLPLYQEHFVSSYRDFAAILQERGIKISSTDISATYLFDHINEYARALLPHAVHLLGDGLLIAILAAYFLVTLADHAHGKRSLFFERLADYGSDVQRYVAITAQTSAIAALANFVVLVALGVDFPIIWCVLYFFVSFVPNVGFLIAIAPPILLALIMSGWTKALLVGGALIVINLLQEYVLIPMLTKKSVDVSFIEVIFSLLFWSFLLGSGGTVLAIPLTLVMRKVIERISNERGGAAVPSR